MSTANDLEPRSADNDRTSSECSQKTFSSSQQIDQKPVTYEDATTAAEDIGIVHDSTFKQTPYSTEGLRNPGWLTVIASFLVNFFVFGTVFTWGDYQDIYFNQVYVGQTDLLKITFVGTSTMAILLGLGLFTTPMIQAIGFRKTMTFGGIVAPLSLILCSFATQLWHVYLSQGILFGISSAFIYSPSMTLPSQWFTKRRALATGIAASGSGIGGVCLSPMVTKLAVSIGYRNTLRVQGCIGFILCAIAIAFSTSRYRPPRTNKDDKWYHVFDITLMSRKFSLMLLFGFFVPFGYLAPFFLAPQFAPHIGLDATVGASMISVMSGANSICRITLGYLADRTGKFNTLFACTFLSAFFTMVIWQFADSYAVYAVYCVLYGLTGGGFVSLLPVTVADIVGVENIQKGLGMAFMTSVVGSLVGTPIVGLLVSSYGWTTAIQFSGATTMTAAVTLLALRMMMSEGKVFVKV